jgi:hypothetical protein
VVNQYLGPGNPPLQMRTKRLPGTGHSHMDRPWCGPLPPRCIKASIVPTARLATGHRLLCAQGDLMKDTKLLRAFIEPQSLYCDRGTGARSRSANQRVDYDVGGA